MNLDDHLKYSEDKSKVITEIMDMVLAHVLATSELMKQINQKVENLLIKNELKP